MGMDCIGVDKLQYVPVNAAFISGISLNDKLRFFEIYESIYQEL
jgi:hypothetical protein